MRRARHMHRSMVAVLAFATSAVAYGQDCEPADLFPDAQAFGTWSGSSDDLATGDLNNDGALDVVAGHSRDGVYVLLATRPGTFGPAVAYGGPTSLPFLDVTLGDFDDDGFLDIAAVKTTSDPSSPGVLVLLNNGDGTFGDPTEWRFSDQSRVVTIADLDGDGNADLIVGDEEGASQPVLGVRLGNGDGTFGVTRLLNASAFPRDLAVADLNGDDRPDVVLSTATNIDVFFGSPGGLSGAVPFATSIFQSRSVAIADADDDGDPDIVFAAATAFDRPLTPTVLFNDGAGGFGEPVFSVESDSNLSLTVGDIDGDGRIDAVGVLDSSTFLWLGDGVGGFTHVETLASTSTRSEVLLADFDNDGATDIATTGDDNIEIRINQCSSFLPVVTQQPPLSVVADSGTIVRIAVEAGLGTPPLAYRWRRNGVPLIEGSPYQGVRTSELAIRASSEETDVYDVVVSNPIGSVPSRPVVLAVRDTCIADLDNDGSLTIFDFLAFQTAFDAGCP